MTDANDIVARLFIGGPLDGQYRTVDSITFHMSVNEIGVPSYSLQKIVRRVEEWSDEGHIEYVMATKVFILDDATLPSVEYVVSRLDRTDWYEIPGTRRKTLQVEIVARETDELHDARSNQMEDDRCES